MKILFAIPKPRSMYGTTNAHPAHPHVGIAYLTSYLKSKNVQVKIFDSGLETSDKKLKSLIKNFKPDLIGVTIFSYCYQNALDLINNISLFTDIPLVVGGPHISATRIQIFKEINIDYAIKHEGEKTLFSLLKHIKTNKPKIKNIPGLIFKNSKNKIIENQDRKFLSPKELDNLPLPDYQAFDIKKYLCYQEKLLPLLTSRGCPYGCNYCSVRLSFGRNFRARSPQNVFNEIKHFYGQGWRIFEINDDCFTTNQARAEAICNLIIKSGINIRLRLYNGVRVDTVTFALLKKMKQAGCVYISFGCESGNSRILKKINKGITKSQVTKASRWCNQLGLKHSINFIIGHTGETYQTALDSINFAKSLPCQTVNFYNLVPYPGTVAYSWVKTHGKFLVPEADYLKYISYRDNTPIFETKAFSQKERLKITRQGFNLYEKKTMQFRFGPVLGMLIYSLTRIRPLHHLAIKVFQSYFGGKLIILLSQKSRN